MYKLILADDEQEARKGIIEKIMWRELVFEVVGEAENGKEVCEIAEMTIPDIVITDIRMPFMDDLELATILKNKFPTIKIIILTAYDEFEYAQQGIKLNVAEYVLKPVSSNKLVEVLLKVRNDIDREKMQREDVRQLIEHYKKALPILREKFLSSVITGNVPDGQIIIRAAELGLDLDGKMFVVAVVGLDKMNFSLSVDDESNMIYEPKYVRYVEDLALPNMAVFNICTEITERESLGIPFFHNDTMEAGIIAIGLSGFGVQLVYGLILMISLSVYSTLTKKAG